MARINSRFTVEPSLREKVNENTLKSPPEEDPISSINNKTFGDDDNHTHFQYDEDPPIIHDHHGCPIFDIDAAEAAFHNKNEDPTQHMRNLNDH